ncbi:MAG: flagellar filament capping protein FliD [Sphingomonadales bacterium]|nr:flagellar filament capping protein FliD [Sphingomonadales bacterium]
MVTTSSTSSSTSATQTAQQTATQQLLTSLNAGSGIDMSSLATNLAAASFSTKIDLLSTKSDTLDKEISAASTLKSALSNLASSLGDRVRQGDLSAQPLVANASVAKATLSGTTQPSGSYSLEVTSLATAQTLTSPAYAAATNTVGSGTLKLRFGTIASGSFTEDTAHAAVDITIAAGATLADVAAAINAKNSGVTAYVANTTDGAKLVFKGASGAANSFVLEASETSGDPGLANLAWNPAAPGTDRLLTSAGNANFKVDGLPITSASNTVNEAIPGVNLTLTGTNGGAPTQISFSDPSTAITTAMSDFTSALNEVLSTLNSATDPQTGDLARDSGARALKRTFSALSTTVIMPNAPEGTPRTLGDLGLSIQRDGTYTLDSQKLAAALKSNPQAAGAMFTNGLYGVFATIDGISRSASVSSDPGTLAGSLARFATQKTQIADQQAKLTDQQTTLRTQLMARFSVADGLITSSKSTLSFLNNQIAAWNKSTN